MKWLWVYACLTNWVFLLYPPFLLQYAHKVANFVGEHLETEGAEELHERLFYL